MAQELETLAVALVAETNEFKDGLDDADKTAKGWASNLGDSVGGLLKGAMLVGVGAVVAGVLSIGTAAFDVSMQVDSATADLAASLGVPTAEAERFADVAREVYGNAFADSVTDAAEGVKEIAKQLGLAADDPSLQTLTENAFRLRDTFGLEVPASVNAANTLMTQFGLTGQQAFDFIAAGQQKGLDSSGDFLDTIGEYSTQFSNSGFSAEEFFSILETGQQGGVLGTDKIADSIKEMSIILNEGTDDAKLAFSAIGLDFDKIAASVAAGDESWAEYFPNIIAGLQGLEDPVARSQAQVGIFGTMAEDLGVDFTDAFNISRHQTELFGETIETVGLDATTSMEDMEGAVGSLDAKYATFGDATSAIWRKLIVSISPYTDALLEMVNNAMPSVMAAMDTFIAITDGTIAIISGLISILSGTGEPLGDWYSWWEKIAGIFGEDVADSITSVGQGIDDFRDKITSGFPAVQQAIQQAIDVVTGVFQDKFNPTVEGATGILEYFGDWIDTNMPMIQTIFQNVLGAIQGFWALFGDDILHIVGNTFDTVFTVIDTVLRTVLDIVTLALQLLTGDWEGALGTIEGITQRLWESIKTIIGNQLDSVRTAITAIDWGEMGNAIIQGIANGIANGASYIVEAAEDAAQSAYDAAKSWLGISSPSKVAAEDIGEPFAEGVGVGAMRGLSNLAGRVDAGLASMMGDIYTPQPAMAGAGGSGINITIYLQGGATYEDGRAVGRGIDDELRARGLA